MKNTIITIASVAALTGAASAQTYNAGDVVIFSNAADFLAGTNGTVQVSAPGFAGYDRDRVNDNGALESHYRFSDGLTKLIDTGGTITNGTATWGVGAIDDFWYNETDDAWGVYLSAAAGGYSAFQVLQFSTAADFLAGTNGYVQVTAPGVTGYDRDRIGLTGVLESHYRFSDGFARLTGTGVPATGTAAWSVGNIDDFWYSEGTDSWGVYMTNTVTIPEPSSTALLGLGALGLLARRKR